MRWRQLMIDYVSSFYFEQDGAKDASWPTSNTSLWWQRTVFVTDEWRHYNYELDMPQFTEPIGMSEQLDWINRDLFLLPEYSNLHSNYWKIDVPSWKLYFLRKIILCDLNDMFRFSRDLEVCTNLEFANSFCSSNSLGSMEDELSMGIVWQRFIWMERDGSGISLTRATQSSWIGIQLDSTPSLQYALKQ